MDEWLSRLQDQADLRGLSEGTARTYRSGTRQLLKWLRVPVDAMDARTLTQFFLYLVQERKVQPTTHHAYLESIRFFVLHVLARPELLVSLPNPRVRVHPPVLPSRSEIRALICATRSPKHRLVTMLAYGAGLRISEICKLTVVDLDHERAVIHVRAAKGRRDRIVMLGKQIATLAKRYVEQRDQTSRWLLPGCTPDRHVSTRAIHDAIDKARRAAGIPRRIKPHTLRHAFATHLLEMGVDVITIQALLGHSNLRATVRYLQISTTRIESTPSPIDSLVFPDGR